MSRPLLMWARTTEDLARIRGELEVWRSAYRAQIAHDQDRKLGVVILHTDFAAYAESGGMRRWHAAAAAHMLDRIAGLRPQGALEHLVPLARQLHEAADGAAAAVP